VAEIDAVPESELKETDALITNQSGICICVQTADCVPVIIYDSAQQIISVVHSGWRGTVNKIVEKTVQKMIDNYGSNAKNMYAAIGPSIGPNAYEVGNEVVEMVKQNFTHSEKLLTMNNSGKFHFNLWEANKQLLQASQVPSDNIEILGECSFELADKYFSARRDGIETGRMVTGIYMKT
jgi:polyphenol oxidase